MAKIDFSSYSRGKWDLVEEQEAQYPPSAPAYSDNPKDRSKLIHVLPFNDLFPHVLSHKDCWCHPVKDEEDGLIVHNSADGREYYESGKRSLH